MKEGDEQFNRWVNLGIAVVFALSAALALVVLAGLILGIIWLGRAVL